MLYVQLCEDLFNRINNTPDVTYSVEVIASLFAILLAVFAVSYYLVAAINRQDCPNSEGQLCQYCFTLGPIFQFFAPQGRYVAPIKVKFSREERSESAQGCGFTAPNLIKLYFDQYNCH